MQRSPVCRPRATAAKLREILNGIVVVRAPVGLIVIDELQLVGVVLPEIGAGGIERERGRWGRIGRSLFLQIEQHASQDSTQSEQEKRQSHDFSIGEWI